MDRSGHPAGWLFLTLAATLCLGCGQDDESHKLVHAVAKGQPAATGPVSTGPAARGDSPGTPRPPADSPFIGAWEHVSTSQTRSMTLRITLSADGAFLATGTIDDRKAEDRFGVAVHGKWFVSGDAVLLRVEATDTPSVFAPSSVLTYAASSATGGVWSYRDAAGTTRQMKRVEATAHAPTDR